MGLDRLFGFCSATVYIEFEGIGVSVELRIYLSISTWRNRLTKRLNVLVCLAQTLNRKTALTTNESFSEHRHFLWLQSS